MNILFNQNINESSNIKISINNFKFHNSMPINNEISYPFIKKKINKNKNKNYYFIYYRESTNLPRPYHEKTKRFIINYNGDISDDKKFSLELQMASHNLIIFDDKDNVCHAIGGLSLVNKSLNYFDIKKYPDVNDNWFFDAEQYKVFHKGRNVILNPNIYLPFFGNGLYLFKLLPDGPVIENNNLPIISGIHLGRYDGYHGDADNVSIEKSKDGLTLFDSINSIIFNEKLNLYFLYVRANLARNSRFIQFLTSPDLIKWSPMQLINLKNKNDYNFFNYSFYHPNFFQIDGFLNFFAILPCAKKNNDNTICDIETLDLYISNDCINWYFISELLSFNYHQKWIVSGSPLPIRYKLYFYVYDSIEKYMQKISFPRNKIVYIEQFCDEYEGYFKLEKIKFSSNYIYLNTDISPNGYIIAKITNINNNLVFNYEEFNILSQDSLDTILTWKNKEIDPDSSYILEIKFHLSKIYSINGQFM